MYVCVGGGGRGRGRRSGILCLVARSTGHGEDQKRRSIFVYAYLCGQKSKCTTFPCSDFQEDVFAMNGHCVDTSTVTSGAAVTLPGEAAYTASRNRQSSGILLRIHILLLPSSTFVEMPVDPISYLIQEYISYGSRMGN